MSRSVTSRQVDSTLECRAASRIDIAGSMRSFGNRWLCSWLHEVAAAWVLRFLRIVLFVGTIVLMPRAWSWRVAALALGAAGIQAWFVWGGSLWLARRLKLIEPPPEHLREIVARMAAEMA